MDNGTWIYIIISIIFFIVNALTKKKKGEGQEVDEMGEGAMDEQPGNKPLSFEELLREIRQGQQKEADVEEREEEVVQKTEDTDYPKVEAAPEPVRRQPEIKYYEGTYQADHVEKGKALVKLDDQVEIDSDKKILKEVEDVAEEGASYNRYRRMLKDPQSLKDAIVVSEILKRKEY
ncbi:hypothetical protein [Echinicola salinicaeni]|uniref:hypothetical protein n=1 Tax=Echinicola salinicaeni TaxID=2762757 RepID=UPI0016473D93|nr:hypothetical protein [Echinicola salinicaeni]